MLRVRLTVRHGPYAMDFRSALTPSLGAFAFRFEGVVVANRILPLRPRPPVRWHCVLRVREGSLLWNGRELGPETTLLLPEGFLLPTEALDLDLRTNSELVVLAAMRLPSEVVRAKTSVTILNLTTASALDAVADRLLADADMRDLGCALQQTWDELCASGFVTPSMGSEVEEPRVVDRVGTALSALSQLEKNPHLIDLVGAARVTERQLLRDFVEVQERFGIVVRGFRGTLTYFRLIVATMFLGVKDLSIRDVARVVGFSSTSAMARAFRAGGLGRPTAVRERLCGADSGRLSPSVCEQVTGSRHLSPRPAHRLESVDRPDCRGAPDERTRAAGPARRLQG